MSIQSAKDTIAVGIEVLERECEKEATALVDTFARTLNFLLDEEYTPLSPLQMLNEINGEFAKWKSPFKLHRSKKEEKLVLRGTNR